LGRADTQPNPEAGGFQKLTSGYAVTETPFADSNLASSEKLLLEQLCLFDHRLSGKPCSCTPEDTDF
jgi:hypothetical protein